MNQHSLLYTSIDSPFGRLLLIGHGEVLRGLYMQDGGKPARIQEHWQGDSDAFDDVRSQLAEYFAGRRTSFDLKLETGGTAFQRRVRELLQTIPYGQTLSYGEVARRIGRPAAARAVGAANGANPISIVIPCHRLIGADGGLTGYAGGIARKRALLELESSTAISLP